MDDLASAVAEVNLADVDGPAEPTGVDRENGLGTLEERSRISKILWALAAVRWVARTIRLMLSSPE